MRAGANDPRLRVGAAHGGESAARDADLGRRSDDLPQPADQPRTADCSSHSAAHCCAAGDPARPPGGFSGELEHDPEKWTPVFGKGSCSNKKLDFDPIQLNRIKV